MSRLLCAGLNGRRSQGRSRRNCRGFGQLHWIPSGSHAVEGRAHSLSPHRRVIARLTGCPIAISALCSTRRYGRARFMRMTAFGGAIRASKGPLWIGRRRPGTRTHRHSTDGHVEWPNCRYSWLPALGHLLTFEAAGQPAASHCLQPVGLDRWCALNPLLYGVCPNVHLLRADRRSRFEALLGR